MYFPYLLDGQTLVQIGIIIDHVADVSHGTGSGKSIVLSVCVCLFFEWQEAGTEESCITQLYPPVEAVVLHQFPSQVSNIHSRVATEAVRAPYQMS